MNIETETISIDKTTKHETLKLISRSLGYWPT